MKLHLPAMRARLLAPERSDGGQAREEVADPPRLAAGVHSSKLILAKIGVVNYDAQYLVNIGVQ